MFLFCFIAHSLGAPGGNVGGFFIGFRKNKIFSKDFLEISLRIYKTLLFL